MNEITKEERSLAGLSVLHNTVRSIANGLGFLTGFLAYSSMIVVAIASWAAVIVSVVGVAAKTLGLLPTWTWAELIVLLVCGVAVGYVAKLVSSAFD